MLLFIKIEFDWDVTALMWALPGMIGAFEYLSFLVFLFLMQKILTVGGDKIARDQDN
jgi:hypothetical protein